MAGPPPPESNPVDWQHTFKTAIVVCVACACLFGIYTALTHKPHLVYPPGYSGEDRSQQIRELQMSMGSGKVISKSLVDSLMKAYNLDENGNCIVGAKYGAVCSDGSVTYTHDGSGCLGHGGVKDWIECR